MMSRRDMGKANFIDVRDKTDRIQVYVRMNDFKIPALKKISELASTASTAEDNISGDDGVPF